MSHDLVTARGLRLPDAALDERFARGSGPGGQHRNVTASAVELVADLAGLDGPGADLARRRLGATAVVRCDESRSQWRNRRIARRQLAELLDEAATPEAPRRPTRPSPAARRRRLEEKRHQSERKQQRAWRPD